MTAKNFSHDTHPAPDGSTEVPNSVTGGQDFGSIESPLHDPHMVVGRATVLSDRVESPKYGASPIPPAPPIRALCTDAAERKAMPIASACLDYFPLAIAAVAAVSRAGQKQHGTTGWDRSKSGDEADALIRHFMDRGTLDTDGLRHSAKVAWRALALLQKELEAAAHLKQLVDYVSD